MAVSFTSLTLRRHEAVAYQQTLDKDAPLYQRINTILSTYQSGIHTTCHPALKINATLQPLLGGVKPAFIIALKQSFSNPEIQAAVQASANECFRAVIKEAPSESEELNIQKFENFQNKLNQLAPDQKREFQKLLQKIDSHFEDILDNQDEKTIEASLDLIHAKLVQLPHYDRLYQLMESSTIPGSTLITTYRYVYGAGVVPNRELIFRRNANGQITVLARAFMDGKWIETSAFEEDQMSVEASSTSERMNIMLQARAKNSVPVYPLDKKMSDLSSNEKLQILRSLEPLGPWRISVRNGIGLDHRFEKVIHLNFYRVN